MNAIALDFSQKQTEREKPLCVKTEICQLFSDFKKVLLEFCINQTTLTPVILIINQNILKIKKALTKKKIAVECLNDQEPYQIESSLQIFTEKQNGKYQVYLINEKQGRGFDFPSNAEIEKNGGVHVIITFLPKNYMQYQQFIGRTGRIGNKGQYSVVLFDKQSINCNSEIYLQKKLQELINKDIMEFAKQKNLNTHVNQIIMNSEQTLQNKEEEKYESEVSISQNGIKNFEKGNALKIFDKNFQHQISVLDGSNCIPLDKAQNYLNNNEIFIQEQLKLNKRTEKFEIKQIARQGKKLRQRDLNKQRIDALYFENYSNPEIHEEMIKDSVRMNAFEKAINQYCKGKQVIDVGAGSGILSMLAAKSGANHVYAIEGSNIAKDAQQTVKDNNLSHLITILQEQAEEIILPVKEVDVILSEWMGYFLLFENMLPSVLSIRDNYLKENGQMIPSRGRIYFAAFKKVEINNGLNLGAVGKFSRYKARVGTCKADQIISSTYQIFNIDLTIDRMINNSFQSEFSLQIEKEGLMDGFIAWFDVDLTEDITLSTSPYEMPTHWQQTLFYIDSQLAVKAQDKIDGKIEVQQMIDNYRALEFQIAFKASSMRTMKKQYFYME